MTNKETYAEAKRVLAGIQHQLDTQPLTAEKRKELERHAAALAGVLLHPWLPVDSVRRLIMLGVVLLGLQQAWVGNYQAMALWLLLPFFSPRIVGEVTHFCGRIAGGFRK